MLEKLPSLLGFAPRSYTGGPTRFHLPLFYDLVAGEKPRSIVVLGYGDGQAFFTLCQAVREQDLDSRCIVARRAEGNETDDVAWISGKRKAGEFYVELAEFRSESPVDLAKSFADGTVDLLLIDDCDSGTEVRRELSVWEPKLAPNALVLFHGTQLERADSPRVAWEEWTANRAAAELTAGLGIGIARNSTSKGSEPNLLAELFGSVANGNLPQLYEVASQKLEAEADARRARRDRAALQVQKAWLSSVLVTSAEGQRVMDHQVEVIRELEQKFEPLHRDRVKAQLIMDTQADQLKQWVGRMEALKAENKKLKTQVSEQKQILKSAKKACRKKGRCFQLDTPNEKKPRRSIPERIVRELRRIPANLGRLKSTEPPVPAKKSVAKMAADPYPAWITEHEPDAAALDEQRRAFAANPEGPKFSFLLPTCNPPASFLNELFASIAAQTYGNFELCVADGGSDGATKELLQSWQAREPRLRVEFLGQNFGIAENTNRALAVATGDFFICIDQDDLLPPFAVHEMARAISRNPDGDIFYSDEDRLSTDGKRHSPFFKPEWSPEYLLSFMYLGHLTAYRRGLVERVGGFRKEFDLSQDYDFALRATELARAVCHVPHVLYHWREHPASGSVGGKPEARASNLAALAAAMERRGLAAEIIEYPTANRARLKISDWPKVSIIVPTDSGERARICLEELPRATTYPDYEIVLVTNSRLADSLEAIAPKNVASRFVRYDKAFNFSDKCNLGAQAAKGSRLIFLNDDVESAQPDWIQQLIEPLESPEVGAVSPKLLYATGKIQHAGLVTGVRGLVGTACHQWPGDSVEYSNLAQSMRDVSALSAACLAMRRDDFFAVGGFDAVNTPIAHSDLDLCFKVRAAGMRCVYTPFVTMTHRGHESIGALDEKERTEPREKASLYLLKRWPGYTCHDPYFPDNMRDWLYADSPTPIRMWARDESLVNDNGRALLFVSHDLSWSGAPLILLHVAKWCRERGYFVVLMSPKDGPLREKFVEAGIPVMADPLILKEHPSFAQFAREFDCVIASTIFGAPIVRAAKAAGIPHLWWIHEGRVAEHYLAEDAGLRRALNIADLIVTPDTVSAQVYQPFNVAGSEFCLTEFLTRAVTPIPRWFAKPGRLDFFS